MQAGGRVDPRFGVLTTYKTGLVAGIVAGLPWACDNYAFGGNFDPAKFLTFLKKVEPYRSTCLFLTVPDVVGDAVATLNQFTEWQPRLAGWPLAFVAQDGQENLDFPDPRTWDVLFIGGGTQWKESQAAIDCIKRAQALGKRIHIGRVNWKKRYDLFRVLEGSEEFTCDGTRHRFDGVEHTLDAWAGYMAQRPLISI